MRDGARSGPASKAVLRGLEANDHNGSAHDRQLAEIAAAEQSLKMGGQKEVSRDWVDSTRCSRWNEVKAVVSRPLRLTCG